MVRLGSRVKDSLTGFKGIATTRTEYLYGCVHIGITPEEIGKDGKPGEIQFFDEQRVVVVKENAAPKVSPASSATSGGPSLYGYPGGRR